MNTQSRAKSGQPISKVTKEEPEELIEFADDFPEEQPTTEEDQKQEENQEEEEDDDENDEDDENEEEEEDNDEEQETKAKTEENPNQRILVEYAQGILPGDVLRTFECLPQTPASKKKRTGKEGDAGKADSAVVPEKPSVIIGPGIRQVRSQIISTRSGIVRIQQSRKGTKYWIDHSAKRYVPAMEDQVIGIIVERFMDYYKVDIGCNAYAILSNIAFEGATKRNKPNLQVGNLVYARVVLANKDLEPELVCYAATNRSEGFGELKDGYMFECSQALSRSLMLPDCFVLQELGKRIPFEIACGVNGRVWINSQSHTNTVILTNIITDSEFLRPAKIQAMVDMIFQKK